MAQYLVPDRLLLPAGWREGQALRCDAAGCILAIEPAAAVSEAARVPIAGGLVPGFVNAHGHLELAHMKGALPPGQGMLGFAEAIVRRRNEASLEARQAAAQQALADQQAAGIAGLGDISNTADTLPLKQRTPLHTHTFIELLGADPSRAAGAWSHFAELLAAHHRAGLSASWAPHAPYSVCRPLFQRLLAAAEPGDGPLAMHLLESAAERAFFEAGAASAMAGFFDRMGIAYGDMPASPLAAAQLLAQFPGRRLLVHLTEASEAELATLSQDPNNYFCLCPRANRFIHGREPEYQRFDLAGGRVCIGTDSLAGNGSLDILAELQAIRAAAPTIPSAYLLHCATQNGAAALGWAGSLGQLRAGTAPGLNQLAPLGPQGELLPETELQVLYPAAPPGA